MFWMLDLSISGGFKIFGRHDRVMEWMRKRTLATHQGTRDADTSRRDYGDAVDCLQ